MELSKGSAYYTKEQEWAKKAEERANKILKSVEELKKDKGVWWWLESESETYLK